MKKQIMALFALAVAQVGLAQEETSATLYGYVRGEFAFDSRQVIAAREGNYIDLATPIKITLVGPTLSCQAPAATTIKAEKNPPIP